MIVGMGLGFYLLLVGLADSTINPVRQKNNASGRPVVKKITQGNNFYLVKNLASHLFPAVVYSYLMHRSYRQYSNSNDLRKIVEDYVDVFYEGATCPLLKRTHEFLSTECARAGHSDVHRLKIYLKPQDEDSTEDQCYEVMPLQIGTFKTEHYDVISFTKGELVGLGLLLEYATSIDFFRKQLIDALCIKDRLETDNSFDPYEYKFLLRLFALLPNTSAHDDITDNSSDSALQRIVAISDQELSELLEKLLNIWAACIHHEVGHMKQWDNKSERLYVKTALITASYAAGAMMGWRMQAKKRLLLESSAVALGFITSELLLFMKAVRDEWVADANVVNDERYLEAMVKYFWFMHSIRMSCSLTERLKSLYHLITDVHPDHYDRAANFYRRLIRLRRVSGIVSE